MGGEDHRCEWRDRAEALEARLAQVEATLEKLQRHQFGARSGSRIAAATDGIFSERLPKT